MTVVWCIVRGGGINRYGKWKDGEEEDASKTITRGAVGGFKWKQEENDSLLTRGEPRPENCIIPYVTADLACKVTT